MNYKQNEKLEVMAATIVAEWRVELSQSMQDRLSEHDVKALRDLIVQYGRDMLKGAEQSNKQDGTKPPNTEPQPGTTPRFPIENGKNFAVSESRHGYAPKTYPVIR